jgi:hypothetical protein
MNMWCSQKERDNQDDLDLGWRIMLIEIYLGCDVAVRTGLNWCKGCCEHGNKQSGYIKYKVRNS